jgi:hypothetical protein
LVQNVLCTQSEADIPILAEDLLQLL